MDGESVVEPEKNERLIGPLLSLKEHISVRRKDWNKGNNFSDGGIQLEHK